MQGLTWKEAAVGGGPYMTCTTPRKGVMRTLSFRGLYPFCSKRPKMGPSYVLQAPGMVPGHLSASSDPSSIAFPGLLHIGREHLRGARWRWGSQGAGMLLFPWIVNEGLPYLLRMTLGSYGGVLRALSCWVSQHSQGPHREPRGVFAVAAFTGQICA